MTVRVGFVPSVRSRGRAAAPWYLKMRQDSLEALAKVPGLEVIAPQAAALGTSPDAEQGFTEEGVVATLDEAEGLAAFFQRRK
ncbi:MAG: hypothetical protein H5T70_06325, partial [Chloroflexi bacterium]|nr:hypothetical protein [Chloroflexota bacterium]